MYLSCVRAMQDIGRSLSFFETFHSFGFTSSGARKPGGFLVVSRLGVLQFCSELVHACMGRKLALHVTYQCRVI